MFKDYTYVDTDGVHWPDTTVGSDRYYAIDVGCFLDNENETLTSVSWGIPSKIVSSDDYIEGGDTAVVKLKTDIAGVYTIACSIDTEEGGRPSTTVINTILKVY